MQLRTRVWSAGRFFAIFACLVATYLLFAITSMRVALKVREVPVPDLRNHTVAEATATLLDEGLVLNAAPTGRLESEDSGRQYRLCRIRRLAPHTRQRSIHVWLSQGRVITVIHR